jgi:hypothetical protein
MAKESGLGMSVSVDDSAGTPRDISNDVTSVDIRTPSNTQDVTGLNKSAIERLLLLADAEVVLKGVFNDAANMSHTVLKNYRTLKAGEVGRTVAIVISGQTLSMEILFENYDLTRAADGSLVWSATGKLADGTVPAWS